MNTCLVYLSLWLVITSSFGQSVGVHLWIHHQFKDLNKEQDKDYSQPEISVARKVKIQKIKLKSFH